MKRTHYTNLENWQTRRQDKKMELYWERVEKKQGFLNSYQEYRKKYNFREKDYNTTPSNNGLDLGNPGFAFTTNLVKYLRHKSCLIVDGHITDVRYED